LRRHGRLHQLCHRQKGSLGSLNNVHSTKTAEPVMRIVWVKADKLLPVQNGGNIRARYGWPAVGERFSEVLRSAAEKKSLAVCAIPARLAEDKA
jgi:hypothetical protein